MSSFVAAMDNNTSTQLGENGHTEYAWSTNPREKISQFYFQLVRTKNKNELEDLSKQLNDMITHFKKPSSPDGDIPDKLEELVDLYRLIGHTRDVIDGKGERMLSYIQIMVWYKHYPVLAELALKSLVYCLNEDETPTKGHQYGSWNDIKYFCQAVQDKKDVTLTPLIDFAICMMSNQLHKDLIEYRSDKTDNEKKISLAVKFAPREGSKFNWLFEKLAIRMFPYIITARSPSKEFKARKAAYTALRQTYYSPLNKFIDTVEVKMADKNDRWNEIDYNHVPSKALGKYRLAWLNELKDGSQRSTKEDRIRAAEKYKRHIQCAKEDVGTAKVHGRRCEIYDLVKQVIETDNQTTLDQINLQWNDHGKMNGDLSNVVAMVDTSTSMTSCNNLPLYNAIGLGIRIAEKASPAFRDRVLTFNTTPEWVNLSNMSDFSSKVKQLWTSPWGGSTDIYKAFELMLEAVKSYNVRAEEVANMTLIILSDMQIDESTYPNQCTDTLYANIEKLYRNSGFNTPPHIVFWNLRKTTGFPVKSNQKNVTMISGFSSVLLNQFCEKGVDILKNYDGYTMIREILNSSRYDQMENIIRNYFTPKNQRLVHVQPQEVPESQEELLEEQEELLEEQELPKTTTQQQEPQIPQSSSSWWSWFSY